MLQRPSRTNTRAQSIPTSKLAFNIRIFILTCFCSLALAQQLQAEEEHIARQEHEAYMREQQQRQQQEAQTLAKQQELNARLPEKVKKEKKKGDCIVM